MTGLIEAQIQDKRGRVRVLLPSDLGNKTFGLVCSILGMLLNEASSSEATRMMRASRNDVMLKHDKHA